MEQMKYAIDLSQKKERERENKRASRKSDLFKNIEFQISQLHLD